jgi:anti-anti-sigma factor
MAEIQLKEIDEITILDVKGPLEIGKGDELLLETFNQLQESSRLLLVINLLDVSYIEDSPLGALLGCCARIKQSGGYIKVVNAPPRVAKFMDITKLSGVVFQYCENEESAVSALKELQNQND